MLIDSFAFAAQNLKSTLRTNYILLTTFVLFAISIDIIRGELSTTNESAQIIIGIFDTIGTTIFYAFILNSLLGVRKFSLLDFFTYFRVNIVYSLIFFIGLILFVVPGLYFLTFFYLAPIIAIEGKENGNYFRKSKELVKKSPWSILVISSSLLLIMAFDFWFMGLVEVGLGPSLSKVFLFAASNIVIIFLDVFLFSATVYLYQKFKKSP